MQVGKNLHVHESRMKVANELSQHQYEGRSYRHRRSRSRSKDEGSNSFKDHTSKRESRRHHEDTFRSRFRSRSNDKNDFEYSAPTKYSQREEREHRETQRAWGGEDRHHRLRDRDDRARRFFGEDARGKAKIKCNIPILNTGKESADAKENKVRVYSKIQESPLDGRNKTSSRKIEDRILAEELSLRSKNLSSTNLKFEPEM